MQEAIIGIDLGTTNSEVAVIQGGKPIVIEEDGDPILPSFVGLGPDGKLLVGKAARNQWALAPERTIKSIKRKMGQDVAVRLGDQEYRPQEISAMILRTLRDRASKHLGTPVTKAVITVPAYFNDSQRQATREAGELAGLEVVRILNEPTAASLTYDAQHAELQRILVYDLGGGTFDVSIVQAQDGVIEVLASHGDTQLGGDDFDELLLGHVLAKFETQHQVDLSKNSAARARLLRAAEAAKRQLSYHPFARIDEEFIAEKDGQALHVSLEVSRQDYEELIRPLILRTMDCVQKALEDSKLTGAGLDKVILVGGSTRTPLVTQLLEERLGKPAHQEVNPDLCVALGAGVQAGLSGGLNVGAVLVDITPHSLGIRTLGADPRALEFSPIIHRNTALPTTRSEVYQTAHDGQEAVDIDVFQGEDPDIRFNHQIGHFRIEGLADAPRGNQIVVQFDLNLDGMLKVTARERATGLNKHVTIENALSEFVREEHDQARARIDQLWAESGVAPEGFGPEGFGDDASAIPLLTLVPASGPAEDNGHREAVQARALIEKAERLMGNVSAEDRAEIERLCGQLRGAVDERHWRRAETVTGELSDLLFYIEDA